MIEKAMPYPLTELIPYQDALLVFARFAQEEGAIFFDSAQRHEQCGRYSFIALDPFMTLQSKNGIVMLNDQQFKANPFLVLAENIKKFSLTTITDLPPFQGGVAGFFSYDLYQHLEKINSQQIDDMHFPDLAVGFYDLVIAFDHQIKKAWIFSSGYPFQEELQRITQAKKRLAWLQTRLASSFTLSLLPNSVLDENTIQTNFSAQEYQTRVNQIIHTILAGDIFEANLTQRFKACLPNDLKPFDLYRRLRLRNPAPFSAYLQFGDTILASASPERFLKLTNKKVEARPIKGTRPRGKTKIEDALLAEELINSAKDHAENVMIVDLLRNDLSRVCKDHSVEVTQLCGLESYATVHHLVSVITGQLRDNVSAIDLLCATFPGGSITGAPKIRAMEIIAELEPTRRGPYCGSIGYIGFNGDMDSSIVIRTYAIKNNDIVFQTGGAVVADSDPVAEYNEMLIKANALHKALVSHDFVN
jgi:para-aminobenzoate synthetase component 1